MVHFVFKLTDTKTILHAHSRQKVPQVVNLPILGVSKDTLQVPIKQHPNFNFCCDGLFSFLPEETRNALLATIPKKV